MKTYKAEKIRRNRLLFNNRKKKVYTEKDFLSCDMVYCIKDLAIPSRDEYVEYNKGQVYNCKKETIGEGRFAWVRLKEVWLFNYPRTIIDIDQLIEHFRPI